jgi:uncharacterized protein YjbJ (UPF0337 family)
MPSHSENPSMKTKLEDAAGAAAAAAAVGSETPSIQAKLHDAKEYLMPSHEKDMKTKLEDAKGAVQDKISDAKGAVQDKISAAKESIQGYREGATEGQAPSLQTKLHDTKDAIQDKISDAKDSIQGHWDGLTGGQKSTVPNQTEDDQSTLQKAQGKAGDLFYEMWNTTENWWKQMLNLRTNMESQYQGSSVGRSGGQDVSIVHHSVETVNGTYVSYLNDNGNEFVDLVFGEGMKEDAVDPLKVVNMARTRHGLPARENLTDVRVQKHRRQRPHFYLRSTRMLPSGSWVRYENDDGEELITEGHVDPEEIKQSKEAMQDKSVDKHPLLNRFRRAFGLPEIVQRAKTDL